MNKKLKVALQPLGGGKRERLAQSALDRRIETKNGEILRGANRV